MWLLVGPPSTDAGPRPSMASLLLVMIVMASAIVDVSFGCSCIYSHPQEHYCSSDFVALVNVRRQTKSREHPSSIAYSIKVKKEFKVTEKAQRALSRGLLYTSRDEASCGRTFEPNTRYLITGRLVGDKPWVSQCSFAEPWHELTTGQRKGFRRAYGQGCRCRIREQPPLKAFKKFYQLLGSSKSDRGDQESRAGFCQWRTKWDSQDCLALHAQCLAINAKQQLRNRRTRQSVNGTMSYHSAGGRTSHRHSRHRHPIGLETDQSSTLDNNLVPDCQWALNDAYRECQARSKTEQDLTSDGLNEFDSQLGPSKYREKEWDF